jgi:PAS domain S-box-containing protein
MTASGTPKAKTRIPLTALSKVELIERLAKLPCAPTLREENCTAERLRLDLMTHQVELEAQNQELRESQERIEEARDRYHDLYNFAPVGYATLDKKSRVLEINMTGAILLGETRKATIGNTLVRWLSVDCRETLSRHLKRVFTQGTRVVDEILLCGSDGAERHISLTSIVIDQGEEAGLACRTILVDITPLKENEAELTRSRQQLRALSAHLEQVREDERRHLAREIHDELGQQLTALRFEVAMRGVENESRRACPDTAALLKQVDQTIESVRAIATNLRPAVLDLGLVAAIDWQVRQFGARTGIAAVLKVSDEEINLDNTRATALFRIVQESLTNIVRHAGASQVVVTLRKRGDNLDLIVEDNGVGLPIDALGKARSFGLVGMRERALLLNGTLNVTGIPGLGTKLEVSIPLQGES